MNTDIILALLKIFGSLISGLLGLTALFSNFRNANGKLNTTGKFLFLAIFAASAVATITSGLESFSNFKSNKEQIARSEALLREISRAVQPISQLDITYFATIPAEALPISYVKRLEQALVDRIADLQGSYPDSQYEGLSARHIKADRSISSVSISPDSDLWPHLPDEEGIDGVLRSGQPSVSFVRDHKPLENYPLTHGDADLSAFGFSLPDTQNLEFEWEVQERQIRYIVREKYDKEFWHSSGKITSFGDLLGSQFVIALGYSSPAFVERISNLSGIKVDISDAYSIARSINLEWVNLSLGDGRSIIIASGHFEKNFSKMDGRPVFGIILPENDEDLLNISNEKEGSL